MQTRQMLCRPCFTKQWLTLACVRSSARTSTPCSTGCTVQQAVKSTFQLTPTEFSNQAQQITDSYGKIIFDRNSKADKTTEEPQAEANDKQINRNNEKATLGSVIKLLYEKGKDFAASLFSMNFLMLLKPQSLCKNLVLRELSLPFVTGL